MSDETRAECERAWTAWNEDGERIEADNRRWEELAPVLKELEERFFVVPRDPRGEVLTIRKERNHRVDVRLAFALKAHLLDEGTGWSPP